MPVLQLVTNIPREKITHEVINRLTDVLAETLEKPKAFCAVHVQPDQLIAFAGSNDPCAVVNVMSIGRLGVEENKKHSAAIGKELESLGIPTNRAYINFNDAPPSTIGFSKTTFADPSVWPK